MLFSIKITLRAGGKGVPMHYQTVCACANAHACMGPCTALHCDRAYIPPSSVPPQVVG
jgi:hypothetical protein